MEIILLSHPVEWLFVEHLYQVLGIVVGGVAVLSLATFNTEESNGSSPLNKPL